MQSWSRRVAAVMLCGVALLATTAAKPVPDLKFQDLAGQTQRLSGLRGSVAVVSFWATWCAPCREEMPRLSALKQRYATRGVRFVAISVDEPKDRAKIEPFLSEHSVTLDVWTGADIDTLGRLGLGDVVPATMVLDGGGEVVGRISGEAREEDVTAYLDWLLGGRTGQAPPRSIMRH
jgi:thiol-disulfide isomerase/thioredoxin